jgi:signal transduction histidine kinase/CheY-like chemotaxis protein
MMVESGAIGRESRATFDDLLAVEQGDIRDRYQRFLFILVMVLVWAGGLRWTVLFQVSPRPWANMAPLVALLPALLLAYGLRARPGWAIAILLASLGTAVTLEAYANVGALPLLLYGPLVVLIGAVATPVILIACSAACAVLAAALAGGLTEPIPALTAASVSLLACTIAAWIASRPIYDSLTMALYNASDAIRARDELREQRLHLAHSVKMLDEALYRQSRLSTSLILARQQAEEARQLKVRFANMISHEIRTPLNIVISFSEVMANSPETYGLAEWPSNLRDDVNEIYRAGRHLLGLINDVLELAQVEANRVVLKRERVPLLEVVSQAVSLTRGWYDHAGLSLRLEAEGDIPDLLIDRVRIRQVLINLLSNARHYTAAGGVTVRLECLPDEVQVSVRDTGLGIAKENLARLFDEFARFGDSGAGDAGSGLGLSISQLFIQLHGGRMWAESAGVPGQGTTVFFTLPIHTAATVADVPVGSRDSEYWQSRYDQARSERVVLVAADDPAVTQVASRLLSNQGRVVTSSLAGAPQVLGAHQPDAVVVMAESSTARASAETALAHFAGPIVSCALDFGAGGGAGAAAGDAPAPPVDDVSGWLIKPITRDDRVAVLRSAAPNARLVLSVEDDAQMARFYQVALARERRLPNSPDVINVSRADQVMPLLARRLPDVILLDLNLGDATGWEVLRQIRSRWSSRELPVIIVTAMDRYGLPVLQANDISVRRPGGFGQRETVLCLQNVLESLLD